MNASDTITAHFRLTKPQIAALRRLGLITIADILRHFPARYERAGESSDISHLVAGQKVTLYGELSKLEAKRLWKSRRTATEGIFEDATGKVKVLWFNQPYIAKMAPQMQLVKLTGSVAGKNKPYITNPEIETLPPGFIPPVQSEKLFNVARSEPTPTSIFPVYPETRGITSRWFFHALERIFGSNTHITLEDPLPSNVRERYHLPDLSTSLMWAHKPEKESHAEVARKRFAFEEIFVLNVMRAKERAENDALPSFQIDNAKEHAVHFLESVSFKATRAQHVAIEDILADLKKNHPMARLLEGDVGSGKTLVAAATAYAIVNSRPRGQTFGTLQVGYMAPTEILATQHFQSFIEYFRHLPINIALITGSGCKKFPSRSHPEKATDISRSQLLKWVASGEIAMLVGTHTLIQKAVQFKHLAYAIVDEQHRFGTKQRRELARKGDKTPHFLSMTATPIPRTLALTMYGDLDLSILDELPPGRAKITTRIIKPNERSLAYEAVRTELAKGRQAFIICPRIEEPDPTKLNALQAKSAKAEAKRLKAEIFPEYRIGLLHGSVKTKEKDEVMRKFAAHEIDILVATSVVEVGINVPNATVMLIEGAERFGLAQLHQLRGRIMRSSHPPLCFLLPEKKGEMAMKRLKALEKSDNGFELAESDLETRGAGDLIGRKQWGMTDLGMEALKNIKLIRAARIEAAALIKEDPGLSKHSALKNRVASTSATSHQE
ncbi:MAG: ATP-dependent DNA helicase RecG [Parcubacteria group bacterium Gr01-1014_8]|nr:MAG: ATP-dependent DNA helicase RecG [Parcubacteria group bacterium Gr01-1014_8]